MLNGHINRFNKIMQAKDAAISADHDAQNIMNFDASQFLSSTPESKHHRVLSTNSANSTVSSHSAVAARSKRLALHSRYTLKVLLRLSFLNMALRYCSGGESSAPSPTFGKRASGSQFAMDEIYDLKSDESLLMSSSRGMVSKLQN